MAFLFAKYQYYDLSYLVYILMIFSCSCQTSIFAIMQMKTFILSQFNYCPLVWMFCDRTLNNKINRAHEKALCVASENEIADFNTLLLEANSVSIHKRNLQMLMIEVYKAVQNVNPNFMKKIFVQNDITHNLRNNLPMCVPITRTTRYGIESLSFLGCKLWNNLREEFKAIKTLASFKSQIEGWKDNCNCRLCRKFISHVVFLT